MIVLLSLSCDLISQLFEISHNKGVDYFHVLVVLCGEVVFHQADLLTQQVDFFFVFAHVVLWILDDVGDVGDLGAYVVAGDSGTGGGSTSASLQK